MTTRELNMELQIAAGIREAMQCSQQELNDLSDWIHQLNQPMNLRNLGFTAYRLAHTASVTHSAPSDP